MEEEQRKLSVIRRVSTILLLLTVISSCQEDRSFEKSFSLRKVGSTESVIGLPSSLIVIGKTHRSELEPYLDSFRPINLIVNFDRNDIVYSAICTGFRLEMSTGVKLGSPKEEVIKTYGNPIDNDIDLKGGGETILRMSSLNYKTTKFILDEKDRVMAITFYRNTPLSRESN